jgi:hypothetical protein
MFLKEVGQLPDIADLHKASLHDALAACYYAFYLYQSQKYDRALEVIEPYSDEPFAAFIRVIVAMETPRSEEVLKSIDISGLSKTLEGWDRFNAQLMLRFLGKLDEATEASRQFLLEPEKFPPANKIAFGKVLEYCAGNSNAATLVRSLDGRKGDLCNAHLCIALTELAKGNRIEALLNLENAVATRFYEYLPYEISGMLLSRLKRDPNWPPWIAVKSNKDQ